MNVRRPLQLGVLLTALVPLGAMALAQEQGQQVPMMGQGMHDTMGQQTDQPMMGSCPMMGQGKQGMVGQGMGPGMMHGSMGPGMMQGGMGPGVMQGGMAALFGSRVTPMMNLSPEDVRGYLGAQLDRLDNKRLKVGDIKADDGTITADIVTVDNSLVQRLKVDRHTGTIEYQN
jgi:hypothetical protein